MSLATCFQPAAASLASRAGRAPLATTPSRLPRLPAPSPAHSRRTCTYAAGAPEAGAASSSGPPLPPPDAAAAPATDAAAALPAERLKQLRRDGLALKDVIKVGRLGVAEGIAVQVRQRWNTSEVARLHCHGKQAVNMRQLAEQLEATTGGVVVQRSGGTVLLYRGDDWAQRQAAARVKGRATAAAQRSLGAELLGEGEVAGGGGGEAAAES